MYRIVVHRRAARYLQKSPQKESIKASIKALSNDPFNPNVVKKMLGEWQGYYRIRVQNIRVIYCVNVEDSVIYVDYIGARGDVYKR